MKKIDHSNCSFACYFFFFLFVEILCQWVEIGRRNCFDPPFQFEQISFQSIGSPDSRSFHTPVLASSLPPSPRAQSCPSPRERVPAQFYVDHQDRRKSLRKIFKRIRHRKEKKKGKKKRRMTTKVISIVE